MNLLYDEHFAYDLWITGAAARKHGARPARPRGHFPYFMGGGVLTRRLVKTLVNDPVGNEFNRLLCNCNVDHYDLDLSISVKLHNRGRFDVALMPDYILKYQNQCYVYCIYVCYKYIYLGMK